MFVKILSTVNISIYCEIQARIFSALNAQLLLEGGYDLLLRPIVGRDDSRNVDLLRALKRRRVLTAASVGQVPHVVVLAASVVKGGGAVRVPHPAATAAFVRLTEAIGVEAFYHSLEENERCREYFRTNKKRTLIDFQTQFRY